MGIGVLGEVGGEGKEPSGALRPDLDGVEGASGTGRASTDGLTSTMANLDHTVRKQNK